MNNKIFITFLAIVTAVVALSSCSNNGYLDCIPSNTALILSYDHAAMKQQGDVSLNKLLSQVSGCNSLAELGVDDERKIYLFETSDGTMGLCAAMSSQATFKDVVNGELRKSGFVAKTIEQDNVYIAITQENWLIGTSEKALILVNPTIEQSQNQIVRKMSKWLKADGKKHFADGELFGQLESVSTPIALVAQANTLPEMITSLVCMGLPKNIDPTQVIVKAEINPCVEGFAQVNVQTLSFKNDVEEKIEKGKDLFNSVDLSLLPEVGLYGISIIMNTKGGNLLKMLRERKEFQSALAAINTAIDIDNIIKTFDGETLLTATFGKDDSDITLFATATSDDWKKDVAYWKRSCPSGTSITDAANGWFDYKYSATDNGERHFFFGMKDQNHFLGSSNGMFVKPQAGNAKLMHYLKSFAGNARMIVVLKQKSIIDAMDPATKQLVSTVFTLLFGYNDIVVVND